MNIAIVDRFAGSRYGFSKCLIEKLKEDGHHVTAFNKLSDDCYELTDFDIVHFDWADGLAAHGIKCIEGAVDRITVRLHAYELHERWMAEIPWGAVDKLIFVSEHYRKLFNSDVVNTEVIHHGINLDKFKFTKHTGNKILCVGSINFKKGPQLLAQAAMALPDYQIDVYGDIQCERSRIYFEHLGISNLKINPYRIDIENVMINEEYKYILSTSLGESFHLSIAEGMACGLIPLVHDWHGAKDLWPHTWKTIDELKHLISVLDWNEYDSCIWIEKRYDEKKQLPLLINAIIGEEEKKEQQSIAACMITRSCFDGVRRALTSCHKYINAAYIAVDSRDEDGALQKGPNLLRELGLKGEVKQFNAPDPWDFSFARNIAHEMNRSDWALVLDDDEIVQNPENIPKLINKYDNADIISVNAGMGLDEYQNVSHTWSSTRLMRRKVKWKNPRHNVPDPATFSNQVDASGETNLIIVDDKSIRRKDRRIERNIERDTNAEVLRNNINEHPNDTRSIFYLAITHKEAGRFWEAILWYKHYLDTGGWDEERWQACYDLAACYMNLRRWSDARAYLHKAIQEKWDRAEAFILMGDIFYACKDYYNAMLWYELGCALPLPKNAKLFVRKSIYEWERYDKLSMAYNHLEETNKAIENANKVLLKRPNDQRVLNNIKVWKSRLKKPETEQLEKTA